MRSPLIAALTLAGIALADAPLMAQRGDQAARRNGWLSSLSEGKRQAQQTGKPLMVVLRCVP